MTNWDLRIVILRQFAFRGANLFDYSQGLAAPFEERNPVIRKACEHADNGPRVVSNFRTPFYGAREPLKAVLGDQLVRELVLPDTTSTGPKKP